MTEFRRGRTSKESAPDTTRQDEAHGRRGAFRPDGSWWPEATSWNDETRYVNGLVHLRRTTAESPQQFAARIATGSRSTLFSGECLAVWARLPHAWQWPCAPTRTAADEAIKRCGFGDLARWHHDHQSRWTPDGWCTSGAPEMFLGRLPSKPADWPQPPKFERDAIVMFIAEGLRMPAEATK